jgi:tetratricopeptide (TPR) repeat protein
MGSTGFDEGIHILDPVLHRYFLTQQRKDAYTQSSFAAGDRVVVCAACGSAHLFDSWRVAGDKCCGCNNQTFSRTLEVTPGRPVEFKTAHHTPSVRSKRYAEGAGLRRSIGSFFAGYESSVRWAHKTQAGYIAFLGMVAGIAAILLIWFHSHQSYHAVGDFWSEFAPSGLVRALCAGACGGFIGWIFRSLAGKIVELCFYIFGSFMVPLYLFGGSADKDAEWPDAAGRFLSGLFLAVVNTVSVGVVVSYFFVVDSSRNEESAVRFVDLSASQYKSLQSIAIKFGQDVFEANKYGRDTSEIWGKFCHDFGQVLTRPQGNPMEDPFDLADKEFDRGEYDRAIADYTEAIRLRPDDSAAYHNRGNAYDSLKKCDQAIADYTEAIRLKPYDPDIHDNRGNAYVHLEKYDQAIADYTEAIRFEPNNAAAYFGRGVAYIDSKEYAQAIADYTVAIRLKPDSSDAYNNRGNAYEALRDYDRAIADYTEAIRLKPDVSDAYNNRATVYYALGQWLRAEADWAKAKELSAR